MCAWFSLWLSYWPYRPPLSNRPGANVPSPHAKTEDNTARASHPPGYLPLLRAGALRLCGGTAPHAAAGGDSRAQHLRALLRAARACFTASAPARRSRSLLDAAAASVYLLCALATVVFVCLVQPQFAHRLERRIVSGPWSPRSPTRASWACRCWSPCWAHKPRAPAILTILVDLLITSSLCIALSRLDGAD